MKKTGKTVLSIMLTLLLVSLSLCAVPAFAEEAPSVIASGACGENLNWTLDNEGLLTVSGTGEMTSRPGQGYGSSVKKVVLCEGVTNISEAAFAEHRNITEVTIPDSVTEIGNDAFLECLGLTEITIPGSVKSIGSSAFEDCRNLERVVMEDGVESIGSFAFSYCLALSDLTVPDSVHTMMFFVLRNTAWLDAQPDGLVFAGKVCYGYKGEMPENTVITLPADTTGIVGQAFYCCESLTGIVIPEGVTTIIGETFVGCTSLESITIPRSVTSVGDGALEACPAIRNVFYGGSESECNAIAFGEGHEDFLTKTVHFNATDHTPGDPVREHETAPTCTADGSYTEVICCAVCGEELSRTPKTVAALAHRSAATVAQTAATATAHGYTEGVYCPDCETWLSGHEVIHNTLGARRPAEEENQVYIKCSVCGEEGLYEIEPAAETDPPAEENGGGNNESTFSRIRKAIRSSIDWVLRLLKWFGGK